MQHGLLIGPAHFKQVAAALFSLISIILPFEVITRMSSQSASSTYFLEILLFLNSTKYSSLIFSFSVSRQKHTNQCFQLPFRKLLQINFFNFHCGGLNQSSGSLQQYVLMLCENISNERFTSLKDINKIVPP